jgi:multidrug resistance efflux pump
MKQFKLREEKTFIKVLKEPPVKKAKVNWSRRVYIFLFLIALCLVLKRVYNANMIIFANGQIELPKQAIKFSNDIKLIQLFIEDGAQIKRGDTLFMYQIVGDQIDQAKLMINQSNSSDWILKEQLNIKKKISLNQIMIDNKNEMLKIIESNIEAIEELLLAGLHEEYGRYINLQDEKAKMMSEVEFYRNEIRVMKNQYNLLQRNKRQVAQTSRGELAAYDEIRYFRAPIDGVVSDIFYEVNEICYKKEELMTIHQLGNASIVTYFDQTEIENLEVGDHVEIEFPDGTVHHGVISKFFVSTYAVPTEFQKKYEPTERNIVAEVIPLLDGFNEEWKKFNKMEVRVKKIRYNLFAFAQ